MKSDRFIVLLSIILMIFMGIYSARDDILADKKAIKDIENIEVHLKTIKKYNDIIVELQKERGLSDIYHAFPNEEMYQKLQLQRSITLNAFTANDSSALLTKIRKQREKLLEVDLYSGQGKMLFGHYTNLISELHLESESLMLQTHDIHFKNLLAPYNLLRNAQEHTGHLRDKIGVVLASKNKIQETQNEIIVTYAVYKSIIEESLQQIPAQTKQMLDAYAAQPCVIQATQIFHSIENNALNQIRITPSQWFDISTCAIDYLNNLNNSQLQHIQEQIQTEYIMAKSTQTRHVFFWCGGLLTLLILLFVAWQHSKASALKHHLLENYKAAIDYSAIVSKSDAQGIITYANDAFCKISGYTHDELLNQPHSLVRHPDTDREVFQAMWQTLKAGQKWQGVLKNQKKDGTPYWVDISIVPIFNNKGALEEYIAIRKDVTQIVLLNEEIKETQSELINRLGEAVESRSKETGYHIQRVAHYSRHLACLAGLSQDECEHIFSASTMHDVGKITIPDAILLKEGKLESDEWEVMKTHAETGYKILAGSNRPLLKMAADIAHEHHEHFNGLGYPRGLKGEAISIHGRIVAITDVFDALATERIYKKAWPLEQILEHIKQQSGQQFDPELIALFLDNIDDFMRIKDNFKNE